jgi:hypothetical protein
LAVTVRQYTDTASLVDEAFDEAGCALAKFGGCSGKRTGYLVFHDCLEGIICAAHHAKWVAAFEEFRGPNSCDLCDRMFASTHDIAKVYPL